MKSITGLVGLILIYLGCAGDEKGKSNNPAGGGFTSEVVGAWKCALEVPYIAGVNPEAIDVDILIDIRADSNYSLFATADSVTFIDTLFIHLGRWSIVEPNILLTGNHCEKIVDSVTNAIDTFDCGAPVPVPISIDTSGWTVSLEAMEPISVQIGIPIPDYMKTWSLLFSK